MPYPADLQLVTVHGTIESSSAVSGQISFRRDVTLAGSSIIPPRLEYAEVVAGDFTIQLPAGNDPDWTPAGWPYTVEIVSAAGIVHGTMELDYLVTAVELDDVLVVDGAVVGSGDTYVPLSQRAAANGVATLDGTTKVPVAQIPAIPISGVTDLTTQLDSKLDIPVEPYIDASDIANLVSIDTLNESQSDQDDAVTALLAPINVGLTGFVKATDHGLAGWTFDPAGIQASTVLATAGLSYVARIRCLTSVITGVRFHFVAGGASLTAGQCFASVHNDAGAQLGAGAITADQAANWATGGDKLCPLTVAQGATAGAWYRVRWWFNGTTGPQMSRGCSSSPAATNWGIPTPAGPFRFSTADSGLTTAASAPEQLGTQTGFGIAYLVGLY